MSNKDKTLWVFIDDSISKDNKNFMTMYIVTEYSNFDTEIKFMKSKLRKIKSDERISAFLNWPKYNNYARLGKAPKKIVEDSIKDFLNKIIEHTFLSRKIILDDDINYYYRDHISKITKQIVEKYSHTYKKIIFDHTSNPKINKAIVLENNFAKLIAGSDRHDTGLIVVDLLRMKIDF